jgi:hypothetical protein
MKVYDSSEVSVILGAINVDSGRAKGPFVRVEAESDDYGDDVGADGETVRWAIHDDRATVTLILMASSASNQALSALRLADKIAPNGAGIVPFLLKDNNSSTMLIEAEAGWIARVPNTERGQEPGQVEWKIRLANAKHNIAGY